MTTVRLKSLSLRNFRGIRDFHLDLGGASARILGRNATGKTSVADGVAWALFDKDSRGRAQFEIKTLDEFGRAASGLEHTVEVVLDVDGDDLTLAKTYREKWVKKRGSSKAEFTGHETLHHVDGVPVTKTEYQARVAGIADEGTWRLLSDPTAFASLHWQERRRILLEVCGDVTDEDVIASDADLAELPTILGKRNLDEHRKVVTARRAEINRELQALPVRIDEAQRALPGVDTDPDAARAELEELRTERAKVGSELAEAKAGRVDATTERRRLREIEDELTRLERDAQQAREDAIRAAKGRVSDARAAVEEATRNAERLQARITEVDADAGRLEERLAELRSEWAAVNARAIEAHTPDTCPACKQALPAEQVAAAHRAAIADLNAKKARELERITEDGRRLKASRDQLGAELASLADKLSNQRAGSDKLQAVVDGAVEALEKLEAAPVRDVTERPEYARLATERDELAARIHQLETTEGDTRGDELQAAITDLDARIAEAQTVLARADQQLAGEARITELKGRERELASEFEEIERQIALMEQFTRTKVSLLESRVSAKFRLVSFRLFTEQVNGGLAETADVTVNGVPYDALNHAAQIQAGLDVIQTLQEHHDLTTPVLIDQAESIHDIPDTGAQQVALIVSPADAELRVELQTPEEVAA